MYLLFIVSVHAFVSNGCVQPSQPSPSQPRPSGPRCCGVCLPTRCPASPLPTLHLLRSPPWRCCPFAWQARKNERKEERKKREIIIQQRKQNYNIKCTPIFYCIAHNITDDASLVDRTDIYAIHYTVVPRTYRQFVYPRQEHFVSSQDKKLLPSF